MKIKIVIWGICFFIVIAAPVGVLISANNAYVDVITIFGDFPSLPLGGLIVWVFTGGLLLGFIICLLPTVLDLRLLKKVKKQLEQAKVELERLQEAGVQS